MKINKTTHYERGYSKNMTQQKAQQPTQEREQEQEIVFGNNNFEYGFLVDRVIEIFCNERLSKKNAMEFRHNLQTIKELYGIRISKEYIKPYFRKDKATFRGRLKKILAQADLKLKQETRYTETLSNKNGTIYVYKNREILNFFEFR